MKTIFHLLLTAAALHAGVVEYELEVAEKPWAPEGLKPVKALTINGGIPGPTLRFRVGDTARITVKNRLQNEETSTHWHGLLVPNAQDGVPYLTTPPIKAGTDHVFEFPLKHPGTYWYHSHTGLQEQRGVYGSIVVEPRGGEAIHADAEHVLVISDWTRENPNEVMRTLMRGSDWYSIRKGNAQSISGAMKAGALADYFQRERSRMAPMDVSDVAYDAFLINGRRQVELGGKPGQKIRLRVINAGASSYFYLSSSTGPLTIVAADGPAVEPVKSDRLLIGIAETYDLIVTIPKSGKWEFRATSQDGSGHASAFLGNGELHPAQDPPKPDLYRMDDMLTGALSAMDMDSMSDAMDEPRPPAPYAKLRSPAATTISPSAPRRTLELRLTGNMERYVWSINGKTAREDGVIKVSRGEVLRLEFVNDTMMHHPMHLHGHFFRVIDGKDDSHAPLKHTIDVPPMGRRTIEFLADEHGDWLFHCHLLYHMHTGMSRVFSYDDQGEDHTPDLGEMAEDPIYFMADGNIQSHMSMGMLTLMNARNDFTASWDVGIHHDHMGGHDYDYEADFAWKRYIDPNFRTLLGYRLTNDPDAEDRFIGGIEYRLPYMVWTGLTIDSEGDARITAMKDFQLTPRLSLMTNLEYDTGSQFRWSTGLSYTLTKRLSLITEYDSDHGFGGGIGFRF
ncbi:multicopper oxidase domain-containing protein [Akkermansiaceae bacterium]|nr:multicopper oxidase domain-containing protein [Akkermansiaceae bacterium]